MADDATLRITLTNTITDFIEDLYKITIDQPRIVFIALDPTSGAGDLDMYLFTSDVSKKKSDLLVEVGQLQADSATDKGKVGSELELARTLRLELLVPLLRSVEMPARVPFGSRM